MVGQILIAASVLIVVAGLFAMVEAAVSVSSPARAAELVRAQARGARAFEAVALDAPRHVNLLMLLRLGCEMVATTLVALVAISAYGIGWTAAAVTAGSMTLISYVVVGVMPRTLGRQHAYTVGRITAPLVRQLGQALGPLTSVLILLGNAVTPGKGFKDGPFATTVELREMVELAERRGVVEHDEREMINSVFALGSTIAREVMVPRTETVWIEAHKTARQALVLALRSGFSRIPVIGESVDDILGVVYLKDLVKVTTSGPGENSEIPVARVMREASFVPESKPIDDLLREMQAARIHIAIVVDEYGGMAGLVTIEDILEEIVGEITDEYDVAVRPPIEHLDDGAVRVSSRLPVEDLAEIFGARLRTDEVETVAGLMAQSLGRVPIVGAQARVGALRMVAEGVSGRRNRIDTIVVRRVADEESLDEEPEPTSPAIGG